MAVATMTSRQKEKNSLYQPVNVPEIPSLENGDHLTREEFERRYDAMPQLKKAELVQGRVYKTTPLKDPDGTYIKYTLNNGVENGVRGINTINFTLFAKDLEELQVLSDNLKNFLRFETTSIGTYEVFYVMFQGKKLIDKPTTEKFYVYLMDFDVYDSY